MRCSVSPAARNSLECMSRQYAQPLIWDALIRTRSSNGASKSPAPIGSVRASVATRSAKTQHSCLKYSHIGI